MIALGAFFIFHKWGEDASNPHRVIAGLNERMTGRDSLRVPAAINDDAVSRIATVSAAATRAVGVFIKGPVAMPIAAVEWLKNGFSVMPGSASPC